MANAIEYVDRDEYEGLTEVEPIRGPQPGLRLGEIYLGTIQARQLNIGETQIEVGYISATREVCIGDYTLEIFEVLLLMDTIKQGMDQILLDHETARHLLRHSEGQA